MPCIDPRDGARVVEIDTNPAETIRLRAKIDTLTAMLCEACAALGPTKMVPLSPELRLWWAEHQQQDDVVRKVKRGLPIVTPEMQSELTRLSLNKK